jgi:hypothetical protein
VSFFVIEYAVCSRPSWIAELDPRTHAYGVTSDIREARRFPNGEDARHEILRLGLAVDAWIAAEKW